MHIAARLGWRIVHEVRDRLVPPRMGVPVIPPGARSWATDVLEPTLAQPVSQLCTHRQFDEPEFAFWTREMQLPLRTHRKLWEFVYILQSLRTHGMLAAGRKGLGFGTGQEPLPAVMAKNGVEVLATDLDTAKASARGWVDTNQHASALADLNQPGICEPERFARLVRFEFADMNALPPRYNGFDFCWSACALEHLGSIDAGLEFIENSLRCLKPGGVAVHTTEYNCCSDSRTLKRGGTVIFRMQDFLRLGEKLRAQGHEVSFNFHQGDREVDRHVDVPPYSQEPHLKLRLMKYVATSIGLTIRAR
ncbi:MAG: hypothetical protein JWQ76_1083 [Ramlibacter sp.]|nr:hypothetical protein [Ramlibacter sp.]